MKAKTYTGQGYIYFVYEDYDGERYNSYAEIRELRENAHRKRLSSIRKAA